MREVRKKEMKNILNNKNFSLLCCVLNIVFATQAYQSGSTFMFILCMCFAIICGYNYKQENRSIWDD